MPLTSSLPSSAAAPVASPPLALQPTPERSRALTATAARSSTRPALPAAWLAAGLLALTGVAGAAYWAGHATSGSQPGTIARLGAPTDAATGIAQPLPNNSSLPTPVYSPAPPPAPATDKVGTGGHANTPSTLAAMQTTPTCVHCGVVESVQVVHHKGQASGVGAVAGGVLGGVLGHQVGGGNGRTAMMVLGAVGGGLAGHEVEKRSKATTTYRVKVRTDGGDLRTVEQRTALAVGQRVRVNGPTLHAIAP